jgi:hypothetical protein
MVSIVRAALPFLGLLAVVALLAGGVVVLTRGDEPLSVPSGESPTDETPGSIPPIDAAPPATLETATFALG